MMNKTFNVLCLVLLLGTGCAPQLDVYISPEGNDDNRGTADRPLATLQAAKQQARTTLQKHPGKSITIWLGDGRYHLEEPLRFRAEDSGKEGAEVQYRALPGAHPVVSGGVAVTGWKQQPDGVWRAGVPDVFADQDNIRELFVQGRRAPRARHPNAGYLRISRVGEDRRTNFYFEPGDFPMPHMVKETELVVLHDWSSSRIKIQSVDAEEKHLIASDTIGPGEPAFFTLDNWEQHPRYFLENDRSFLDSAYEWYSDKAAGHLYLQVPATLDPNALSVVVPYSRGLLQFEGTRDMPVSHIRFEGIAFKYCRWNLPEHGYGGVQACHFDPGTGRKGWEVVPPAIGGDWMESISFEQCSLMHLGGSGLWFGPGSRNCKVISCHIADVSGNGLMIGEGRDRLVGGEPWWKTAPEEAAQGNTIQHCEITRCGQQFFGAVGIWCGLTANTSIMANTVYDLPYTGVSIGWMWSPQPTPCRDNSIEQNHIYNIMKTLSDGGGIYMLGLQPGSRLVRNRIHDVQINVGRAESNGMFLDEGTTDVLIEENLIYDIARSPLRFHRATVNVVRDNVLMCREGIPPVRYNNTDPEDIKMEGNSILLESDPADREDLLQRIGQWKSSEPTPQ